MTLITPKGNQMLLPISDYALSEGIHRFTAGVCLADSEETLKKYRPILKILQTHLMDRGQIDMALHIWRLYLKKDIAIISKRTQRLLKDAS